MTDNPARSDLTPALSIIMMFLFFRLKEKEPKENALAPLSLARRRIERVSRKLASLGQVREPNPFDTPMLSAGQRGLQAEPQNNEIYSPSWAT